MNCVDLDADGLNVIDLHCDLHICQSHKFCSTVERLGCISMLYQLVENAITTRGFNRSLKLIYEMLFSAS